MSSRQSHITKAVAHRGAFKKKNLKENSIEALIEASKLGCHATEFDVRITHDDQLILNHDEHIDCHIISETGLNKLKEVNPSITELEEFLTVAKELEDLQLILELKECGSVENTLRTAQKAVELIRKMNLEHRTEYITFSRAAGRYLSKLTPNSQIAYLEGDLSPKEVKELGFTGIDYEFPILKKNSHWITEAKDLGMTVNSWTVDKEEDMRWLINKEVDWITTDEPELLMKLISE